LQILVVMVAAAGAGAALGAARARRALKTKTRNWSIVGGYGIEGKVMVGTVGMAFIYVFGARG
jgi:hypothetical protein